MATFSSINRLHNVIENSVFMTTGNLDYDRVTDAVISLADAVYDYDGDHDSLWSIGEFGNCALPDFIAGAYWHYSEWHGGQWSKGYQALSAIGRVFNPGMTYLEPDTSEHDAYAMLENIAQD